MGMEKHSARHTIKFVAGTLVRDTFGCVGTVIDTTERPVANRYEHDGTRRSFAYGHLVRFLLRDNEDVKQAAVLRVATAESNEIWISGYDLTEVATRGYSRPVPGAWPSQGPSAYGAPAIRPQTEAEREALRYSR